MYTLQGIMKLVEEYLVDADMAHQNSDIEWYYPD